MQEVDFSSCASLTGEVVKAVVKTLFTRVIDAICFVQERDAHGCVSLTGEAVKAVV